MRGAWKPVKEPGALPAVRRALCARRGPGLAHPAIWCRTSAPAPKRRPPFRFPRRAPPIPAKVAGKCKMLFALIFSVGPGATEVRPGRDGRGPGHPRAPGRCTKAAPAALPASGRPRWGARTAEVSGDPRGEGVGRCLEPAPGAVPPPSARRRSRRRLGARTRPPRGRSQPRPGPRTPRGPARTVTPTVPRASGTGGGL